ncbi:MAG: hypothetical protein M3P98_02695 [bacterium]|nr:hypothetical protein [bacterium]
MKTLLYAIQTSVLAVITALVFKTTVLAQAYGCGIYGAGTYGNGDCSTGGGEIADTGINVWLIRAAAVVLILLAVVLIYKTAEKRKNK